HRPGGPPGGTGSGSASRPFACAECGRASGAAIADARRGRAMDRAGARASPPRRSQLGQSPRDEIEAVLAPEEFVPDHEGRHAEHALLDRGIGIGVVLAPYRLVLRGLEERSTVGAL